MDKLKVFQRMVSIPFGLALIGFLFPLFTFSCAERTVAEPNAYELAMGLDVTSVLSDEENKILKDLSQENGGALANVPMRLEKIPVLFGIFVAILVAGLFAFVTPVGSCVMGVMSLISLWIFIQNMPTYILQSGFGMMIEVKPGIGAYCVSMLLIIGIAMSLAAIVKYHQALKSQEKTS